MPLSKNTQRGYVGFSTSISALSVTTNPTSQTSLSYSGVFDTFDYNYTRPYVYVKGSTTNTAALTTTISLNVPTHSPGDLLLAFVGAGAASRTFTSSGWTNERSYTGGATGLSLAILSKVASNSEPASYTFTASASENLSGVMLSISNYSSYTVGTFDGPSATGPITVPDDSSTEKLLLFFISNDGSGRSWDINGVSEYEIQLVNLTSPSLDVSGFYRTSSNTSLSYTMTQTGGGTGTLGICVVIK